MREIEDEILDSVGVGKKGAASKSASAVHDVVEPTLVANMEKLVELAKNSTMNQAFLDQVDEYSSFVANKMNISKPEAVILSLAVEMNTSGLVTLDRLSRYLRCTSLRLMSMKTVLDSLVEKGFLKRGCRNSLIGDDTTGYLVQKDCIDAIMDNKPFVALPITGLDMEGLFDHIGDVFDGGDEMDSILDQIDLLVEKNPDLVFCRKVKKYLYDSLSRRDLFLFFLFCHMLVNESCNSVSERDWRGYFGRRRDCNLLRSEFALNKSMLQKMNLIEALPESGMMGTCYQLTYCAKNDYLEGLDIEDMQTKKVKDLVDCNSFAEKKLFYNPEEGKAIGQIGNLLQEDNFRSVQQRLEECGMRKGFACLFYGEPGTGKTETVNQLARATGRDVMVVDVSQIKDKYVGESEKNIKEAFSRYRSYVKTRDKAPILLFNEADSVLGVRMEGAKHSVDKMNNSIQNIILQEMETLDGIMIATTNLTQNLDSAFERRFIYKVEFHKPSVEAKKNIWLSMIPAISDSFAQLLAERYDLSGGQIENIARKRAVHYVLSGEEPSEDQYFEFCNNEVINNHREHKKVGFCR